MNTRIADILQSFFSPRENDGTMLVWAKELLVALMILTAFWLLSQIFCWMLNRWVNRLTQLTKTDLDDRLLQRTIPHVSRLLNLLGLYLALRSLPLHEKLVIVLSGVLYVLLVVVFFNLIYHAMDELMHWYISGRKEQSDALISRQMLPVAEKLALLFLMGTALLIILKHFNYDIFSIVTALGIGSLAIGMAAKDTLAHMISGFTLMLDRPFQIGDRIKLADGKVGNVIDIGLRSTKIEGLDNTVMVIPNSDLCNSTVINLMRPTPVIQGQITVGVAYDSDVELVKRILTDLARQDAEVLADPAPLALFISFGNSSLNMLLLFWVSDPALVGAVTDRLNCAILKSFHEHGIEIPYPIRTLIMDKGLN